VGLDYIVGLFGCLYAGIVAVPAYRLKTDKQSGARIRTMIEDCAPRLVLTCERLRAAAAAAIGGLGCDPAPLVVSTDGVPALRCGAVFEPVISPDALALLQYTSASVADAKGVRITHTNLMANQRMIREAMSHDEGSHFVSWLPPYHDMGLVGNLLQPLYLGSSCVFMPPSAFIQKPIRWLAAISKYEARTSGAPPFAYDLCVKKIAPEQHPDLDLSRWTVAYCGAEAVDAGVIEHFSAHFAACGFHRDAFYPCYGLAEATLMVSGSDAFEAPSVTEVDGELAERGMLRERAGGGRRLVSCGAAPSGSEIRIVDPDTSEALGDGEIGEIWVAGAHVADGYWGRPDASQEVFQARLAGGSTGYLRTGDLGAVLRGQLYVVGRIKEVIIHHGRNLHPADIESVIMSSLAEGVNACAAFALPGENTEEVGVVVEVARRGFDVAAVDRLGEAVAWEIYRAFEVFPARLAFARIGAIPRTSSGKKRRLLCARLLVQGKMDILAESRHALSAGERVESEDGESAWLAG
jgi:acyl-CoA synthetase (AMP-forming)/AMP-acid ligase II